MLYSAIMLYSTILDMLTTTEAQEAREGAKRRRMLLDSFPVGSAKTEMWLQGGEDTREKDEGGKERE